MDLCLKAVIKAELSPSAEQESMNNCEEARRQGISPWRISSEAVGCLGQVKEI